MMKLLPNSERSWAALVDEKVYKEEPELAGGAKGSDSLRHSVFSLPLICEDTHGNSGSLEHSVNDPLHCPSILEG